MLKKSKSELFSSMMISLYLHTRDVVVKFLPLDCSTMPWVKFVSELFRNVIGNPGV